MQSVQGCIVDANLCSPLGHCKKGEKDTPGLTDTTVPCCLGPKRAGRIHKLYNLSEEDDVRQYVVKKPLNKEGKKLRAKHPRSSVFILHVSCNTNAGVFLYRNNILRKIRKSPQNMLSFWIKE